TSSLNLRQGASTSTAVVTQLKHGAAVTVTGESGDWYAITSGGYSGYVMKKYVNLGGSTDEGSTGGSSTTYPGTIRLSNTASTVNVRAGAGTNTSKLGTLAHGASVKVVASNGDWYKIEYGTGYGYVLKSYVSLGGSSSSSGGSSSSSTNKTATTTTSVNLRATGSTSGTKLGTYPAGTKVTVLSKGSTWSQVSVSGKTGYMKNDYLKFS
ncbi:MAG: SH3 domain-containing protein, partial [Candidatus Spyradocola sp.]